MNININIDKKEKKEKRKCGMITCIHCISNTCSLDKCEFYERIYKQEY